MENEVSAKFVFHSSAFVMRLDCGCLLVVLMQELCRQNNRVTSAKHIRANIITHWLKYHNLRQLQYMAGHRYVSSTEAFLVNDLDDLQEEITKYHPIG